MTKLKCAPRVGDEDFDPEKAASQWPSPPISMTLTEYLGHGDPAFGGQADDRRVLTSGRVAERNDYTGKSAEFTSLFFANEFAKKIPNRRPNSILGVCPRWR